MAARTGGVHGTLNVLSLCSGYGGLELGLDLALGNTRTICWVEWEAYAAALLVARMEEGSLDSAPIWSDVRTFDGHPWRGVVDIVAGGYPCQPFSHAGKRGGADDPRHLWPHVRRIVGEVRPRLVFFENVRGHVSLGLREVLADLARLGYRVGDDQGQPLCGLFSAEEVGASHRRERVFILAVRGDAQLDDATGDRGRQTRGQTGRGATIGTLPDTATDHTGTGLGGPGAVAEPPGLFPPGPAELDAWRHVLAGRPDLAPAVADAERPATGVGRPEEAPEPAFHRMADESPDRLVRRTTTPRSARLRALGNGVVPLTAAFAFVTLAARAGVLRELLDS